MISFMHNLCKYIFAHCFNVVICVVGWSIVVYHDYNLKIAIFKTSIILEWAGVEFLM
jgi:hypothetical protein